MIEINEIRDHLESMLVDIRRHQTFEFQRHHKRENDLIVFRRSTLSLLSDTNKMLMEKTLIQKNSTWAKRLSFRPIRLAVRISLLEYQCLSLLSSYWNWVRVRELAGETT